MKMALKRLFRSLCLDYLPLHKKEKKELEKAEVDGSDHRTRAHHLCIVSLPSVSWRGSTYLKNTGMSQTRCVYSRTVTINTTSNLQYRVLFIGNHFPVICSLHSL